MATRKTPAAKTVKSKTKVPVARPTATPKPAAVKVAETKVTATGDPNIVAHIELLKGDQFQDPRSEQYYRKGQITPVAQITTWAEEQARHGLLKIHRVK